MQLAGRQEEGGLKREKNFLSSVGLLLSFEIPAFSPSHHDQKKRVARVSIASGLGGFPLAKDLTEIWGRRAGRAREWGSYLWQDLFVARKHA